MSGGVGRHYGPGYYATHADALGWGVRHTPDAFKLAFLRGAAVGETLLDLASGPGVYGAALAHGGLRVVSVDFSRDLLDAARGSGDFRAVCASAFALPLRDRSVDTTLLLSVLEHVDDAALVREAARVTRRRIIVQVPLAEPALLTDAGMLFSHWQDRSHLRTYTEAALRDLVAGVGWALTSFVPAYRRDLQELYVRGLAVPELVRTLVRAVLKPLRRFSPRPPAEAFAIAEPR